jgi:NADH-quinone oxidoreductase subunit C
VSRDDNPNVTLGEQATQRAGQLTASLPAHLAAVRDRLTQRFGDAAEGDANGLEALADRDELTMVTSPSRLVEVLRFCRDDELLACELLSDLSGVHWPGGRLEADVEETTGWPTYASQRPGTIDVDYLLTSITQGHRFRVRVSVPDVEPRVPTAVEVYRSARYMERECYDFFGVAFEGHDHLERILMPEDWVGHPHRKDYPLGGVEVQYEGATIPPPDERDY